MSAERTTRQALRVLVIDDSALDTELVLDELRCGQYQPVWVRVDTGGALATALEGQTWDVIICDWVMPQFSGPAALAMVRERQVEVPVIVVSGQVGEEYAVTAMKAGAHDFISKRNLARLCPAVERELKEAEARRERRRAEQQKERYLKLFLLSKDVMCIADPFGCFLHVNPAMMRMTGYSEAELLSRPFLDFVVPEDRLRTAEEMRLQVTTRSSLNFENRYIRKDGSTVILSWTAFFDPQDGTTYATARDMTEYRRAEQALAASEERLRLALQGTNAGLWDCNLKTGEVYYSPRWKSMLGYGEEELAANVGTWEALIEPEGRDRIVELVRDVLNGRADRYQVEFRMRHKDGHYVDILSRAFMQRDERGGAARLVGTHVDISERKRADHLLRESEERFQNAFRFATVGMALVGADGRFLKANQVLCQLLGYGEEELLERSLHEFVDPADQAQAWADGERVATRAVDCYRAERRYRHRSGRSLHVDVSVFLVPASERNPRYYVVQVQDISEQKETKQELQHVNAELEQRVRERTAELQAANEELEAFSYSVSHDLRAPLRSVDGFSAILLERYGSQLNTEGQHYLRRVREGATRMDRLVNDLLMLARIQRAPLHWQPVALGSLARSIATELSRSEPSRQVEFVIAEGVEAQADPGLIRAALENLLGNAWKYTSRHATARIEFGAWERSDARVYFVRDDGAGFDMAYVAKLFVPFQRLHSSEEFDGTGIGLATVQRIVHRHGGRIWAEGAVERGATFSFTLGPAAADQAPAGSP